MRRPSELSQVELICIVESLQRLLYLDLDTQGEFWNPDKSWEGADVCDELAHVIERYGLVPGTPTG